MVEHLRKASPSLVNIFADAFGFNCAAIDVQKTFRYKAFVPKYRKLLNPISCYGIDFQKNNFTSRMLQIFRKIISLTMLKVSGNRTSFPKQLEVIYLNIYTIKTLLFNLNQPCVLSAVTQELSPPQKRDERGVTAPTKKRNL